MEFKYFGSIIKRMKRVKNAEIDYKRVGDWSAIPHQSIDQLIKLFGEISKRERMSRVLLIKSSEGKKRERPSTSLLLLLLSAGIGRKTSGLPFFPLLVELPSPPRSPPGFDWLKDTEGGLMAGKILSLGGRAQERRSFRKKKKREGNN